MRDGFARDSLHHQVFQILIANHFTRVSAWQPHGNQAALFQSLVLRQSLGVRSLIAPGQNSVKILAASPL